MENGPQPHDVLHDGATAPPPERIELRSGPLTMDFEAGDLRGIRLGGREVVRRVYVAVRDRNWNTVPPTLSDLRIERGVDSFLVTFAVENRRGEIDFAWRGTIRGERSGAITYEMRGEARSTFLRNRIGICVHHPIRECAGHPCRVEGVDGTTRGRTFPDAIAPHQPFQDFRAISHEVLPGLWAEVRLEGEVFEMEDQRNWIDASYKTYGTPLALPFPVEIAAGTRVSQKMTLSLSGAREAEAGPGCDVPMLDIGATPCGPLPPIGLGMASHGVTLRSREIDRLRALNLGHLRVDLHLASPDYPSVLERATVDASALGVPLEVALFLTDSAKEELDGLLDVLRAARPEIAAWLVFHVAEKSTGERWVRLARSVLPGYDPAAPIGSGTNVYFAELNRGRPPVSALDFVCYSITPQVHAFDNLSLVETLEAQAGTLASARRFCGELPIAVSPVTLRPRFNPNATGADPDPEPGELPPEVDPRQMSLLGAGWTVGSLGVLARGGAARLTFYETTGWRGVMMAEASPPLPGRFPVPAGAEVFPVYHALADVGEFAGGEILPTSSTHPLLIDALAVRKDGRTRLLLANLAGETRAVRVSGLGPEARVRILDEETALEAMRAPESFRERAGGPRSTEGGALQLELRPYAVARIDSEA